jgi:hypothetical protein
LSKLKSARNSISKNPDTTLSVVDSSHHKIGRECRDESIQQSMLASQIGNNLVVGMGLKSKKLIEKRLIEDFDRVCK